MEQIVKLTGKEPIDLFNKCLSYIQSFHHKKEAIKIILDMIIQHFQTKLTDIINQCIHDINNIEKKKIYKQSRMQYIHLLSMSCIYPYQNFDMEDSSAIMHKYINGSIINTFYRNQSILIHKMNKCVQFVDKVLNIHDHLPPVNYNVKGNLIEDNTIKYSNVCEVVNVVEDESQLPPKKRYKTYSR